MTQHAARRRGAGTWATIGSVLAAVVLMLAEPAQAQQAGKQPNILVIWGDDIGIHNISAYNLGVMGYKTPNIDRLAKEGALFTDFYAQQSCTRPRLLHPRAAPVPYGVAHHWHAGFAARHPRLVADDCRFAPGAGLRHRPVRQEPSWRPRPTPTMHGFDEFLGNLYHLNAEEEPETYYYPKDPEFRKQFGPRGVLHARSDGKRGQTIEDTGALTAKRMETVDDEIFTAAGKFIDKSVADKKPFFVWFNTTRMHVWTRLKKSAEGRTGIGLYPDGMVEHDDMVGALLKQIEDLKIADNTIVIYSTDNGAETGTWPDGGTTPYHGEKGTTWEGGFRVPCLVRWPGVINPGTIINDIMSQEDWMPTLLAAAGEPDIVGKLKQGYQASGKTFKIHPDGYNFLPYFKGEAKKGPREEIYYFGQGGELNAVRWNDWKIHFAVTNGNIATAVRDVPGWPVLINLRADPYEKAPHESGLYLRWYADNIWLFVPVQQKLKAFLTTLPEYPFQQGSSLNAANINYFAPGGASPEALEGVGDPLTTAQLI